MMPANRDVASSTVSTSPVHAPNWSAIGAKTNEVASPLSRACPAAALLVEAPYEEISFYEMNVKKLATTTTEMYVACGMVRWGSRASSP